jgi:Cys-tRNA(Pro) deacylase
MSKFPITPAIRQLRQEQVDFDNHLYEYEAKGGTKVSARELQVDEYTVIKTLIMEDERKQPLIVLMHGNKQVSTKKLARDLGVKTLAPCLPEIAEKHTGYLVGGTSPLGTRKKLPTYMEKTIIDLPKIYINGGKRGFLVSLAPEAIVRVLKPTLVEVAIDAS